MNATEYKIDPHTINEQFFKSKTREMWEEEREDTQLTIYSIMNTKSMSFEMGQQLLQNINSAKEQISYIDEVLERWYSDMCIRCGKLTPVNTYCGQSKNCQHCLKEWAHRAMSTLTDEDLQRIEMQLANEGE